MYPQPNIAEFTYQQNIPMLSREFDQFELSHDLEANLREADTATFYHDAPDLEE